MKIEIGEPITRKNFDWEPQQIKQLLLEKAVECHGFSSDSEREIDAYDLMDICNNIVGMTTYDGAADARMVPRIIDVLRAIHDRKTFEYMGVSHEQGDFFLMVCNLQNLYKWLSWGTSIRGAFFDSGPVHEKTRTMEDWLQSGSSDESNECFKLPIPYDKVNNLFAGLVLYFDECIAPELAKERVEDEAN